MKTHSVYCLFTAIFSIISVNISAQIVTYVDIEPNKTVYASDFPSSTSSWSIDVTGDSVADFTFTSSLYWAEETAMVKSLNGCEYSVSDNYVDTLNYNDIILDTLSWSSGIKYFYYSYDLEPEGNWISVSNKFMAIRIPSGKGWKYGWFRLSIYSNKITIKDFAICNITGMNVFAGHGLPPVARDVHIYDISNHKDGRDLKVNANVEMNDSLVDEYRIICVKTDSASTFSLLDALALSQERYKSLVPTGNNIEITYDSLSLDSDGEPIQEFVPYTVFILSLPTNSPDSVAPCLSLPSNSLTLKSYTGTAYDIVVMKEYNHDLTFTLNTYFSVPENEEGITEYRLIFVKRKDSGGFTIDTALNVPPDNYFVFYPNGQNHSITLNTSGISDYKGNAIEDTEYFGFVLSIADGTICNVNTMNYSNIFDLRLQTPKVGKIFISDNGDNANAGDLTVIFNKVNESTIYAYRVILVKDSEAPEFNLQKANALGQESRFDILPTNSNINTSLNPEMKDSDGEVIKEDVAYRAFVLTLADTNNTNTNQLSDASNIIAIATPDHFKASQKTGTDVFYYDIEPDVVLNPCNAPPVYYFDLNNDGTDDYYITINVASSPSFTEVVSKCIPLNDNEVNTTGPESNLLDVLDSAYMISSHLNWKKCQGTFYYSFDGMVPGSSYSYGLWCGVGFKYLGLRMFDGTDTIYGWLNLKICNSGVIKGFASRKENAYGYNENSYELSVYPNPASGMVYILFPDGFSGKGHYDLTDITGRSNVTGDFSVPLDNRLAIDVSSLKSGVYILTVKTTWKSFNKKIVIR